MRYTAKSIREAKEAIRHIDALGLEVTRMRASGVWIIRDRDTGKPVDFTLINEPILRPMGLKNVHVMLDENWGSEDVRETPQSGIVIEYGEAKDAYDDYHDDIAKDAEAIGLNTVEVLGFKKTAATVRDPIKH